MKLIAKFLRIFEKNLNVEMLLVSGRYQFPAREFDAAHYGTEYHRGGGTEEKEMTAEGELDLNLSNYFGFTHAEFMELCSFYKYEDFDKAKAYYNGK